MPKASAKAGDGQRLVGNIRRGSQKYPPSNVYLQVVGSGARGAPNALYLFTDHNRYLFNCGEATQRLALEHKVKVSRLDHIFITSKTWRNLGGLPGLSITLQQVGVSDITLHGPDGLDLLYNATKGFVVMKDMNVRIANCNPSDDYSDSALTVKYVLLGPHDDVLAKDTTTHVTKKPRLDKEFEQFIHDNTDYYNPNRKGMDVKKNVLHNSGAKTKEQYKSVSDRLKNKNDKILAELQKKSHCVVAFICTLKKRLGTLNLEKCVEMGVKPGPLLGKLKNGLDVVLPDGTLVLSKNVKTPDDPGPVFIVLEIPEISYLKVSEFQAHYNVESNRRENIPVLVVHFTPPHVFNTTEYQSFMAKFGPTTQHLVLNEQNSCLGSEAVHRMQHKLHLLDPEIFPLLRDISIPAVWNVPPTPKTNSPSMLKGFEELKKKIAAAQFQSIVNMESSRNVAPGPAAPAPDKTLENKPSLLVTAGRTLTTYQLRPNRQFDRSTEPKLHIQNYIQETMDVDGFASCLEKFKKTADNLRYMKGRPSREYPKVVFMGTGSSMPGKTRNVSATVVQTTENRSLLLDCGEGTYAQIVRFYGQKRSNIFLRSLRAIYISHLHADHHLGFLGVMQARRRAFEEVDSVPGPLYLLAPGQIMAWLSTYDKHFEKILGDFILIPNQNLVEEAVASVALSGPALIDIGLTDIKTCYVSHCPNAFGVAITVGNQYKITYSGDTIPCEDLIAIGRNSTLLIHEATMEDELMDDARTKMHSTTSQAIDVGRSMDARYTVLTHFSQRYARIPRLIEHLMSNNINVGIAYDNMQITMSDLDVLPHMYAPLQLMFAEHCIEMELKAANRNQRRSLSPNAGTPLPYSKPVTPILMTHDNRSDEEERKSDSEVTVSDKSDASKL